MTYPGEHLSEPAGGLGLVEAMRAEERAFVRRVAISATALSEAEGANIQDFCAFLARACDADPVETLRTLGHISSSDPNTNKELRWNIYYRVNRNHPEAAQLADAEEIEGPKGVTITRKELRDRVRGQLALQAAMTKEHGLQRALFAQPYPEAPQDPTTVQ